MEHKFSIIPKQNKEQTRTRNRILNIDCYKNDSRYSLTMFYTNDIYVLWLIRMPCVHLKQWFVFFEGVCYIRRTRIHTCASILSNHGSIMVFLLDSRVEHSAHICSRSGISTCWRHLVTWKESSNPIFSPRKRPILPKMCAIRSELPSI